MKEIITASIKSIEDKIQLAVTDQKSITNRYDYIKGGDNQSLDVSKFTASANATVAKSTAGNMNAILMTKTDGNTASIQQSLGTLPAGTYEIEVKVYTPTGKKPNYCYFGFYGNTISQYLSTVNCDKWYTLKRTVTYTSAGTRSFYLSITGSSGQQIYLTDIRVLRNVKELIDDVDARITVEAGKITQQVSEMYESNSHNYCTNGSFSDSEDKFAGWYRSNNTQVTQNTFRKIMCSDHERDQHLLSAVVSETVRQKGKSQSKVQSGLCIRAGENSQNQSDNRWNVTLYKCRRLEHILENI